MVVGELALIVGIVATTLGGSISIHDRHKRIEQAKQIVTAHCINANGSYIDIIETKDKASKRIAGILRWGGECEIIYKYKEPVKVVKTKDKQVCTEYPNFIDLQ